MAPHPVFVAVQVMFLVMCRADLPYSSGGVCSWCEAGTCNGKCSKVMDTLEVDISAQVGGRGIPYWHAAGMPSLGQADSQSKNIDLAIIVHHGSARNGHEYFCYMQNAVIAAGRSRTSLVLAPQIFEFGDDGLNGSLHIWWDAARDDHGDRNWKWGGNSTHALPASISSFETLDRMVFFLKRSHIYPNLRKIVFAGHSAGGQIIQRYALFNRIDHPNSDVALEYYPANPSTTTYLDERRPVLEPRTCSTRCENTSILIKQWTFAQPSSEVDCFSSYDKYGYGLTGHLPDYPAKTTKGIAIQQYAKRSVVYMSGESDVCDTHYMEKHSCTDCKPEDGGLDNSCEANAQGWCRMARLHAFLHYLREYYVSATIHNLVTVPGVGHSGCGMFQSPEFAAAAFNTNGFASQRTNTTMFLVGTHDLELVQV